MLSFDLGIPSAAELSELEVGEFFIYEGKNEAGILAVVLPALRSKGDIQFLKLTGEDAFNVFTLEHRHREHVIPLKLDGDRLKLRIDTDSATNGNGQHELGQLVFGSSSKAAIAVTYSDLPKDKYCNAVSPVDWQVHQVQEPRFRFNRWKLSYVDATGQWVNLVEHDSKAESATPGQADSPHG